MILCYRRIMCNGIVRFFMFQILEGVLVRFLPAAGGSSFERQRRELMSHSSQEVEKFYTTWTWRKCRKAFAESKGNLCERCLKRGIIEPGSKDRPLEVHHKVPLTAENVTNPKVTLNWENLELLCKTCHDQEQERRQKRWRIAPDGSVMIPPG